MGSLISIDPGKSVSGWALFESGVLARSGVIYGRASSLRADRCVVEQMVWRPGDARSNANDLLEVATTGAVLAGQISARVEWIPALKWKGAVPKDISHARIRAKLSEMETSRIEDVGKKHEKEVLDAIGIGLFALGR